MYLTDWLKNKFKGLNLELLAIKFNMEPNDLIGIVKGTLLPNFYFVVQVIYAFKLCPEEQLDLFYLVGESLGIGCNAVYQGVVEELVAMTNEKYSLKRE